MATQQGDYARAEALHEESLALRRELGDTWGIAISLLSLGCLAADQHDYARAATLEKEALSLYGELGDKRWIAACLEGLAAVAGVPGSTQEALLHAARLFGVAAALREAIGAPVEPNEREAHEQRVASVRTAIGEGAFVAAWAEGQALTLERAVPLALAAPSPA